ncbi:unnamed protein product [Peronospora farinosa]|uniref:C2H2-type domain-containing protein n=1 Tax=Peronospora farinosa TaxID=134698 RepID=A0ABN8CCA2_9STRA|nr:unnamed protein product [Peronospora farinosa]
MDQGLGEQALVNLLHCSPEQHVAQLEQFEPCALGQRRKASEVNSQATAKSISKTQDELWLEQARNEALNRPVETLSARSNQPKTIRMERPKFDGAAYDCPLSFSRGAMRYGAAHRRRHQDGVVCRVKYAWQSVRVGLLCAYGKRRCVFIMNDL